MTYTFDLRPHEGAGPLSFGMTRKSAGETMAGLGIDPGSSHGASDYYFQRAIQLEFAPGGGLWFIGLSREDGLRVTLYGMRLDGAGANDVAAAFAAGETNRPRFDQNEMLFPQQILTLWDADPQYHANEEFAVWAQIGIGSRGYLEAIGGQSNA